MKLNIILPIFLITVILGGCARKKINLTRENYYSKKLLVKKLKKKISSLDSKIKTVITFPSGQKYTLFGKLNVNGDDFFLNLYSSFGIFKIIIAKKNGKIEIKSNRMVKGVCLSEEDFFIPLKSLISILTCGRSYSFGKKIQIENQTAEKIVFSYDNQKFTYLKKYDSIEKIEDKDFNIRYDNFILLDDFYFPREITVNKYGVDGLTKVIVKYSRYIDIN